MYEFIAPFPINGTFAKEIIECVFEKWIIDETVIENSMGRFVILFENKNLKEKTSYQYTLRVHNQSVQHIFSTKDCMLTLVSEVKIENIAQVLQVVLPRFGVIHYGRIEDKCISQTETEREFKKIIDKNVNFRRSETLILSKTDHNKVIKWATSSDGFYYTLSHWSHLTEDAGIIDDNMFPPIHKIELSELVKYSIQKERFNILINT